MLEEIKKIKVMHSEDIALLVNNPTDLVLIDKGAHGAVFKLPKGKCVKIYADTGNAEKEAMTYKRSKNSDIMPHLYEAGENYIIMDYIEGISLWKYLSGKKEIEFDIANKLIALLKEMKKLGFTRIDSSMRHILMTGSRQLKIIDLVYAYVRKDEKPVKIFTELQRLGLAVKFMKHVKKIDPALYKDWKVSMAEFLKDS